MLDHVPGWSEGVLRDLDRRRQNDQLGRLPPIADQQCQHDRGGNGGFGVFLGDNQGKLFDFAAASVWVVRPKYGTGKVRHPGRTRLAYRRAARGIHDTQLLHDLKPSNSLLREQRRHWHQRLAGNDPRFPVKASS
ncbi:hypothetical protein D3C77_496400 [compost metagenome]